MFIDKMTKKEKVNILKQKINEMDSETLDAWLLEFGYEYSDELEDEEW